MSGRRRVPSTLTWIKKRPRFWIPALFVLLLGGLVVLFEKLPQAKKGEIQGIRQIANDISKTIYPKLYTVGSLTSSTLLNLKLPAWIPIWSIDKPFGILDRRLPSVRELDGDAHKILPLLDNLKEHKFFRIFKTDLSKDCPFWARREMCTSPGSCQICECDDEQIPQPWKMRPIMNFVDRNHYQSEGVRPWGLDEEVDNEVSEIRQFGGLGPTVSDEESRTASYVDLTLNRPGYTAYRGRGIWGLIYKENCMPSNPLVHANLTQPNECTEEEAFYKIISGMQTVIMVLSAEYHDSTKTPEAQLVEMERLKKEGQIVHAETFRAQYSFDLELFKHAVAVGRDWMENLYFTFGVLLKTFCHVGPILETCDCDTGTPGDDALARQRLRSLLKQPFAVCQDKYLDEPLFTRKQNLALQQFQNISRIMDCLECEKCRLHGKVKILALQLALRASGKDAKIRKVERNEMIALVNALEYFADAIVALHRFERRLLRMRLVWGSSIGAFLILILLYFRRSNTKRRRQNPK